MHHSTRSVPAALVPMAHAMHALELMNGGGARVALLR